MHKDNEKAIDQLDAMIFNGDTMLDDVVRTNFRNMMYRWEKELKNWDDISKASDHEE